MLDKPILILNWRLKTCKPVNYKSDISVPRRQTIKFVKFEFDWMNLELIKRFVGKTNLFIFKELKTNDVLP